MDRIPLVMAVMIAGIALPLMIMTFSSSPTESDIQEEGKYPAGEERLRQEEVQKVEKDCTNSMCVMTKLRECIPSEMLVTYASSATQLLIIDGDAVYAGEHVCLVIILQRDQLAAATTVPAGENDRTTLASPSFQSWGCKVPISKLSSLTATATSINEITNSLISSDKCQLTAP